MNYDTHVYTYNSLPADLLLQYGKLRYRSFKPDDPYVNLDHINKTEFDRFDKGLSDPIYIMITADDGPAGNLRLVSAMRFISCDAEYDLEHPSWSYLTEGVELPKSPSICETTRWVGKSSNTTEGMISTGLLNMATVNLAKSQGWTQTLGSPAEAGANWLRKRGAIVEQFGEPCFLEREGYTIQLTLVDLDERYFKIGLDMFVQGVGQSAISRISIADLAA